STTTYAVTGTSASGCIGTTTVTVTVSDTQLPSFTGCPGNITLAAESGSCGAAATWTEPVAADNCPGLHVNRNHSSGEFFPVGTTTVIYTATDDGGNPPGGGGLPETGTTPH